MIPLRRAAVALVLLSGCSERESAPAPAGTWLSEPLAAVRLSELAAGASDSAPNLANPFADAPDALAQGRQLYMSFNCAGCHGGAGGGGIGPPLADAQWIYGDSPANIYASIVQGRPNGMPAFGPSLQGEAVWKLAAYVRSLSEEARSKEEKDEGSGQ